MENALPYRVGLRHKQIIRAITDPHSMLAAKTEEYLKNLRRFELKAYQPGADQSKLLQEITLLNNSMLDACAQFERIIEDPKTIQEARAAFRRKTHPLFSQSYLFNRARTWPQGHQGDFMTLEFCYRNATLSEDIGYYLDKYFLASPLAAAVRERLHVLQEFLKKELKARREPRVLNVGCGSCREICGVFPEIKKSQARFMCIDLDSDALKFAAERFSHAGMWLDEIELLSYNALRMFAYEAAEREFGKQDVIYSLGFFDYLSDDFFVKLIKSLYRLLNPGGRLIVAFRDGKHNRSLDFEWFAQWDGFIDRTRKDFERLLAAAEIPHKALTLTKAASGGVLFYSAIKQ